MNTYICLLALHQSLLRLAASTLGVEIAAQDDKGDRDFLIAGKGRRDNSATGVALCISNQTMQSSE
jgi:hypothetical protein